MFKFLNSHDYILKKKEGKKMQRASSSLHIDKTFTSMQITGGRDITQSTLHTLQIPDLWVQGGSLVEKSLAVRGNILVGGIVLGNVCGDIYTSHIFTKDLANPIEIYGNVTVDPLFTLTANINANVFNVDTLQPLTPGGDINLYGNTNVFGTLDLNGNVDIRDPYYLFVSHIAGHSPITFYDDIIATKNVTVDGEILLEFNGAATPVINDILTFDGTNWRPIPLGNIGGGSVSLVNTGAGLTGGPISSTGTISIATGGVTNAMLVNPDLTVTAGAGLTGGGLVSLGGSTSISIDTAGVINAMLANDSVTVTAGTGLSGGGTVALGGSITLNNTGVTNVATGAGLTGGPITTTGTIAIATSGVTNAMLVNPSLTVTAGSGLTGGGTVSLGSTATLSIPSAGVTNTMLLNPSLTVTAGSGLTGGGSVALGGSTTVSIPSAGVTNTMLANPSLTVTAGTGMSGGGLVSLGSSVTLTNAGVTSFATTLSGLTTNMSTGAVSLGGTLDVGAGGTGGTSFTAGGVVYGNAGSALGVSAAGTAGQLLISGGASTPSWTSTPTVTSLTITENPITNSLHAVTKAYVDAAVTGLNVHAAVYVATTSATELDAGGTPVYYNGPMNDGVGASLTAFSNNTPLTIDGYTFIASDVTNVTRVLVKDQANQTTNGIYVFSQLETAILPWVLTRAADADNSPPGEFIQGDFNFVQTGTANGSTGWVETCVGTGGGGAIVIGTDNVCYTQISGAGTYTAGAGLSLLGTTFSVMTGGVTNAMLANDSITVTAGSGLTGGGAVSLGGSTTLSIDTAAVTNSMLVNDNVTVTAGTGLTGGGSVSLGSSITIDMVDTSLTVTAGSGLTGGGLVSLGGSTSISIDTAAITNAMLANDSVTVTAGTGLSGGGTVALGGSITLDNTGVTNITTGSGLTGGPITTTGTISIDTAAVTNAMLVNDNVNVIAGTGLTGGGAVALGSSITIDMVDTSVTVTAGSGLTGGGLVYLGGSTTLSIDTAGVTNAMLVNDNLTVTAGTGMSGGGSVSLGGSVTLTNAGVTQATGTTNQVSVSASTGSVTWSLPQDIATTSSPTFNNETLTNTLLYTNGIEIGNGSTTSAVSSGAAVGKGAAANGTNAIALGSTAVSGQIATQIDTTTGVGGFVGNLNAAPVNKYQTFLITTPTVLGVIRWYTNSVFQLFPITIELRSGALTVAGPFVLPLLNSMSFSGPPAALFYDIDYTSFNISLTPGQYTFGFPNGSPAPIWETNVFANTVDTVNRPSWNNILLNPWTWRIDVNSANAGNTIAIGLSSQAIAPSAIALGDSIVANQGGGFFVKHRGPIVATVNAAGFIAGTNELIEVTSSRRFKDNIRDLESVGDKFDRFRPVRYNAKLGHGDNREHIGLIAEEVKEVFPEFVTYDGEGQVTGMMFDRVVSVLIKEVQELRQRERNTNERLAELDQELRQRERNTNERLAELERRLQL
jgi:hypothetical protein